MKYTKKSLGQNFLKDNNIIKKLKNWQKLKIEILSKSDLAREH